ncbi:MAG: hypothetical protein AB1633_03380 [Elusimicrobiota bacterium]
MKDYIGNFWTFILTLILLPPVYGAGKSFFISLFSLKAAGPGSAEFAYFILGIISFIVFQIIFAKPIRTYVFGHELTHALAGIISGAKVKTFTVKKSSGSVTLSKAGVFITLAPYFLPVYTVFLMIAYFLFYLVFKSQAIASYNIFVYLVGVTLAFHISLTSYAIFQGQTDLRKYGVLFSILFVLLLNIFVLEGVIAVFFKASIGNFLNNSIQYTKDGYFLFYQTGVKIKCLITKTIIRN